MSKISFLFVLFLFGCTQTIYQPYIGKEMSITGSGGYQMDYIDTSEENNSLPRFLSGKKDYKYTSVIFFRSGLPEKQKCYLLGRVVGDDFSELANEILEAGGNTATMSDIQYDNTFDNNAGVLINKETAGTREVWSSSYSKIIYTFNVFECIDKQ